MAGYADYRRLLMQGYTPEEIAAYFKTQGAPGKVDKAPPESTFQKNSDAFYPGKTRGTPAQPARQKQIYERLPGMEENLARNYDPGIEELQKSPYRTSPAPGEFVGAMPDPASAALREGQQIVAQATGSPPLPMPEQTQRAQQYVAQQQAGPKVNWQNGPSQAFYEASAGWNMRDNGAPMRPQMGRLPGAAEGLPNLTKSIMEQGPQQQVAQQRQMMETAFSNANDEASKNVLQANRSMLDIFGGQGQNPLLGGSFLGKLFGGLF